MAATPCCRRWTGRGRGRFLTSVVPDVEGNALPFYKGLGMTRTGRIDDGEVELEIRL